MLEGWEMIRFEKKVQIMIEGTYDKACTDLKKSKNNTN